jgi:hypothetical protein
MTGGWNKKGKNGLQHRCIEVDVPNIEQNSEHYEIVPSASRQCHVAFPIPYANAEFVVHACAARRREAR